MTSHSHDIFCACSTAPSICASVSVRPLFAICDVTVARQSVLERISSDNGSESPQPIATGRIHVGRAAIDANVLTGERNTPTSRPKADSTAVSFGGAGRAASLMRGKVYRV